MELFDSTLQVCVNGALTENFRAEIQRVREKTGCTYKEIAERAKLSSTFIVNIANGKTYSNTPKNKLMGIRTVHVKRLVDAIRSFEAENKEEKIDENYLNNEKIEKNIHPLTVIDAKVCLSHYYNVPMDSIDITIHW